ncbi:polysaccharide biosynthesis tyrosine autokinase [Cupriavidus metallidurans]|uniref:polysaccharide biosynthesis tyrosine autokinase n=1 Tax=Cupriavidus TaxID=106589 RepID=UPI0002FFAF0B|nr:MULTISPECIES: polysaccharide biosynthesis tyrosine autokinase [Cupriavidus]GMG92684.1 tyrosine-protein kinase involved in EPS biosynthesis [Cupriavidus sp. TKC]HBD36378.1 tyrosine protein kinase [Cupriavidus sp.]
MSNVRQFREPSPEPWEESDNAVDMTSYVDVLIRYRWTFLVVAGTILGVGLLYALMARPIYRADIMVQVEESNPTNNASKLIASISPGLDVKPAATAEMELLRSRAVVGKAVETLRLDIDAKPRYFPLIGASIASYNKELSKPGLFGFGGFAWGSESIVVDRLDVPEQMEDRRMVVTALGDGKYRLEFASSEKSAEGTVGQPLTVATDSGTVSIDISQLDAHAGTQFRVRRVPRATAIANLQDQLMIGERGKQSGVIGVALEDTSAVTAAAILNEIATEYVDQNLRRKAAEAEKSVNFLESQLPQLKQQMETSEARYNAMRNQRGTIDLSEESKLILAQSVQIQGKLQELRQKRQELIVRFTANHPTIEILDSQIAGLTAQLNGVSGKIQKLPDVEQDVVRLMRDVKVNTELYQSLLNDVQQLRLLKASKVGTARLIDAADVPIKPVRPNRMLVTGVSVAMAVVMGLLAVGVRRVFDGGITDAEEIETQCGMTVYATIPMSPNQARLARNKESGGDVLAIDQPDDPAIESLRAFRTALQFALLSAQRNNVVVFTGPSPEAGKSFVSVNFAVVAAAAGRKVILVDSDLRRGLLNERFKVSRKPGLTEALTGTRLDKVIQHDVAPGVDFIATGAEPPLAADLLQSPGMDTLLAELRSRYDLVLIDTPPVLAASDAGILAPKAGAVFMVARADKTTTAELTAARRLVEQTGGEIKGVLFNGLKIEGRWYRSHYHFGKYRYLNRYGHDHAKQA